MKRWKKITFWTIGVLLTLFIFFMVWYKQTYSMRIAGSYEVNDPTYQHHILIATQGSDFKDSVVNEVLKELKLKRMYIRVIDISALHQIMEEEWNVLIVLHTWEYSEPPQEAADFVSRVKDKSKLIVLSTSGAGHYKMEGIDGITSASRLSEVHLKVDEILRRVNDLLNSQ